MRKLSELLPIARSYLCTVEEPYRGGDDAYHLYTCYATELAYREDKLTSEECERLQCAISSTLRKAHNAGAIASVAERAGVECHDLRSAEYIAFRDKWLDRLQSKLEADEKLYNSAELVL